MTLPAIIPEDAKLPERYQRARQQLAECYRVDECQDWADKMAALASGMTPSALSDANEGAGAST